MSFASGNLWLHAAAAVSGFSEQKIFQVVSDRGDWERELGFDLRKRERLVRRLPATLFERAMQEKLVAETSLRRWVEVLGEPRSPAAVSRAGVVDAALEERAELRPEDFTEERIRASLLAVVVAKTGYEPALIRWEADLERDLGIDSVKQAQILGALRKRYPLEFKQGLRLKDFPTLNHWVALTQRSLAALEAAPGTPSALLSRAEAEASRAAGVWSAHVTWKEAPFVATAPLREPVGSWRILNPGGGEARASALPTHEGSATRGLWLDLSQAPGAAASLSKTLWECLVAVRSELESIGPVFVGISGMETLTPLAAALGGALRSLSLEHPERLEWLTLAGAVTLEQQRAEVLQAPSGLEIVWSPQGERRVRVEIADPTSPAPLSGVSSRWLESGRHTLIVGGVQGLGEELAAVLLRAPQARVTLWGRRDSGHPQVQASLRRLAALARATGSEVVYESVNVVDLEAVRRASVSQRETHAVVFAAGVIEDVEFLQKSEESFHRVVETKAVGFSNGVAAFSEGSAAGRAFPQDWAVFSSFSARRGNARQVDYAAANEMLTSFATRLAEQHPAVTVRVLDWGAWAEVGMAARSGLASFLADAGEPTLTVAQGLSFLLSEFSPEAAGFSESLVLPVWEQSEGRADEARARARVSAAPLLPEFRNGSRGVRLASGWLDPTSQLWLREHTIFEDPLMPAVFGIEFLAESALAAFQEKSGDEDEGGSSRWRLESLQDLQIESGVAVLGTEPLEVRLTATPIARAGGRALCEVALALPGGRRCYRAIAALSMTPSAASGPVAHQALEEFKRWSEIGTLQQAAHTSGTDVYAQIRLGPSFQILQDAYAFPEGIALAFSGASDSEQRWPLPTSDLPSEAREWAATPALLEAAFHTAAWIGLANGGRVIVPRALGSVTWFRKPVPGARRGFYAKTLSAAVGVFSLWIFEEQLVSADTRAWVPLVCVDRYETYDVTGISSWGESGGNR